MIKKLMIPGAALLAFIAAIATVLAVQGRLGEALAGFPAPTKLPGDKQLTAVPQRPPPPASPMRKIRISEFEALVDDIKKTDTLYKARDAALLRREERFKIYCKEVEAEKETIDRVKASIEAHEADLIKREAALTENIVQIDEVEAQALQKLATVYSTMDATRAAKHLASVNSLDAAKILFYMAEKKSAPILEEIQNPAKVAELLKHFKTLQEKAAESEKGAQP